MAAPTIYKTLEQHIADVETLLAQTAGTSVQKYSEPRISKFIVDQFDVLFKRSWWAQFRHWQLVTLDGVTGFPAEASDFAEFGDIKHIYPATQQRRLTQLTEPFNPFLITGTTPMYVEPQSGVKRFRVWPLQSTGQLYVQGRKLPDGYPFSLDTVIPFDPVALQRLAAWEYCVDDGNNPMQAEKLQAMFDQRITVLMGEETGNIPIDLDPRFVNIPNQWYES